MQNTLRRVVTGHDTQGRSVIASDGPPTRVNQIGQDGPWMYEVWNTQQTPAIIDRSDAEPVEPKLMLAPPAHGTRIRILDIPPDAPELLSVDSAGAKAHFAIMNAETASTHQHAGQAHPYMHRTESIDYGIVLEGEITLVLDQGEVTLRQGEVVIQRGTNHAWSNRSDKPCRIAFVLIDGHFADDLAG